jgi:hypothetical protein
MCLQNKDFLHLWHASGADAFTSASSRYLNCHSNFPAIITSNKPANGMGKKVSAKSLGDELNS